MKIKHLKQKELSTLTPQKRNYSIIIIFVITILAFVGLGSYLQFGEMPVEESLFFQSRSNVTEVSVHKENAKAEDEWFKEFEIWKSHNCNSSFRYLNFGVVSSRRMYHKINIYNDYPGYSYRHNLKWLMVRTGFASSLDSCFVESNSIINFVERVDAYKKFLTKKSYAGQKHYNYKFSPSILHVEAFSIYHSIPKLIRNKPRYKEISNKITSLNLTITTHEIFDITSVNFTMIIAKNGEVIKVEFPEIPPRYYFYTASLKEVYADLKRQIEKWKFSSSKMEYKISINTTFVLEQK